MIRNLLRNNKIIIKKKIKKKEETGINEKERLSKINKTKSIFNSKNIINKYETKPIKT
jgi:hypothetical protein